jgi:UDP-glucose 4-epimerase
MRLEDELVLIRGAGGFLGSSVASKLLPRVGRLRLFARRAERLSLDLRRHPKVEVVEADIHNGDAVTASLESVDTVLDFVGGTVPATPTSGLELELELTLKPLALLLEAMAQSGTARLIFPSSGGTVYGRTPPEPVPEEAALCPESHYGLGRVLAEEMIRFHARRYGLRYLIARIANPYGRIETSSLSQGVVDVFLHRLRSELPIEIWGEGKQVRDYLFIDDATSAIEKLLDCGANDQTFNVGSGRGHSLIDVMDAIEVVTGRHLERHHREDVYSGIPYSVLKIDKVCEATGWRPRYDLVDGIRMSWRRLNEPAGFATAEGDVR